jgi:hypothetical protein
MTAEIKLDEYWKTRTVAEAMKDYTCLRQQIAPSPCSLTFFWR